MKRQGQTITEIEFSDSAPKRETVAYIMLFVAIVLFVVVLISVGSGVIDGGTDPRLVCYVGEEVVFERTVDAAIQVGDAITITIGNHTNPITPPEGGKCYIAR